MSWETSCLAVLTVLLSAGSCVAEPEPGTDPPDSGSPSTVSTPPVEYEFVWEPDDGPMIEADVSSDGPDSAVVAGESCEPSFVVRVEAYGVVEFGLELYFDGPPSPGSVAPLPEHQLATGRGIWDSLFIETGRYEEYHGGEAEVIVYGPEGWVFRFGGEGLVRCTIDECLPLSGGTLSIHPLPGFAMPPPSDRCYAGEPYTWPNGWEACAPQGFVDEEGECPDTLPW